MMRMAEWVFTSFALILALSLLIYLVLGVIILRTKVFSDKKRKGIGTTLLVMGLLNLFLFNILIFRQYTYTLGEFIIILLFFIIPFTEGFAMLSSKEVKKNLFGFPLIILPVLWVIIALLLH